MKSLNIKHEKCAAERLSICCFLFSPALRPAEQREHLGDQGMDMSSLRIRKPKDIVANGIQKTKTRYSKFRFYILQIFVGQALVDF